jgi:RNA recognition motif-containing protein
MKSLFVGNLNFQTTEANLTALFQPFGQVGRIHIVTDRETGRARGFAFVEMPNDAEVAVAADSRMRITANRLASRANRAGDLQLSTMFLWPQIFEETYERHVPKAPKRNETPGKAARQGRKALSKKRGQARRNRSRHRSVVQSRHVQRTAAFLASRLVAR